MVKSLEKGHDPPDQCDYTEKYYHIGCGIVQVLQFIQIGPVLFVCSAIGAAFVKVKIVGPGNIGIKRNTHCNVAVPFFSRLYIIVPILDVPH